MTRFDVLTMLHGIGVIAWLGGGIGLVVLEWLALRARDRPESATVARQSKALGQRLFGPAWTLTATTGVALVLTEDAFSFLDLWILVGFAGILTSPLIQLTVADRARQRLTTAIADNSDDDPLLRAAARRVNLLNTFDIAILLVVVGVMYARPDL